MTMQSKPARQVCPLCATDDKVELTSEGPDMWLFICGNGHPDEPFQWSPTMRTIAPSGRTSSGSELGVYDDLLTCVHDGECVEYGVVEYRYAELFPSAYSELVRSYGHRSLGATVYSASVFLAHALGQLEREGLLAKSWVHGSGYWSYLGRVSAWAQPGVAPDQVVTTWQEYTAAIAVDPESWTPTL